MFLFLTVAVFFSNRLCTQQNLKPTQLIHSFGYQWDKVRLGHRKDFQSGRGSVRKEIEIEREKESEIEMHAITRLAAERTLTGTTHMYMYIQT